jgi:poly(A) polymerase
MGVGVPIDPLGGLADLRHRLLRTCSSTSFDDDPVRIIRMARLAQAFGLEAPPDLVAAARAAAGGLASASGERIGHEMTAILGLDSSSVALRLLDETGGLAAALPELAALKGCEQNPYHHVDVFDHTLEALSHTPAIVRQMGGRGFLAAPDDCGLSGAPELAPLAWAVLLHDIGKPPVRKVDEQGRIIFWHHDEVGATMADVVVRRLGMSRRFSRFLGTLILNHLRLGFLVREAPLTRRALARYRRAVEPFVFESVALSLADRLATRGPRTSPASLARHYRLARRVWLEVPKHVVPLPLDGRDVMDLLDVAEGPAVGEALQAVRDEVDAGTVSDRSSAREFLVEWSTRDVEDGDDA